MKKRIGLTTRRSRRVPRSTAISERNREHQPTGGRRAPLPGTISRTRKREAERTTSAETPAFIRAVGTPIEDADRAYLRRKLGRRLGKFAAAIERVSVRIEDVNGPRGGIDKRCRIKVVLSGLPSVVIDQRHPVLQATMDRALRRLETSVRRRLQQRQERHRPRPTAPAT